MSVLPPLSPITLHFALTRDEFILASVEMQHTAMGRKARAGFRKGGVAFFAVALVAMGLWVYTLWHNGWKLTFDLLFFLSMLCGALAWLLFRSGTDSAARSRAEKSAHGPMFEDLQREHTLTINGEGVEFVGRDSRAYNRWRLFESAEVTPSFLVLVMCDQRVRVIPRRLLPDAEGLARQCTLWIAADGGGEQRSVVAYLQAHDTPCPKCEYQLRGLDRPQCPECGVILGRENLPQAFVG